MRLQDRDKRLLENLYRFGVMSTRQIATRFFPKTSRTTALRRLRTLEESKLIRNCGHLADGIKVWSLTRAGGLALGQEEVFRFNNQNTLNHDVCVTEARFAFQGMGLGHDWTSEAELKRNLGYYHRDGLVPDGIFTAEYLGEPKVVAFELELSAKSHLRYKNILLEYRRMDAIGVIWYVVKAAFITKPIFKQWRSLKTMPQVILFTLYADLLKNGLLANVVDANGGSRSIRAAFGAIDLGQGQSTFLNSGVSTLLPDDLKANQQFTSAPGLKSIVPSALDPSLST